MSKEKENIILRFCPNQIKGRQCMDENCPYMHLKDRYITMDDVFRFHDDFVRLDQERASRPVQANAFDYVNYITTHSQGKPFLCLICGKPVTENSLFLTCCKMYCCTECYDKWKYPGRCPRCGSEDKAQISDGDNLMELKSHNASFDYYTIVPKRNVDSYY